MSNVQVQKVYFKSSDYGYRGPYYPANLEHMQRRYVRPERLGVKFFARMKEEARLMGFKQIRLEYHPTTLTVLNRRMVKEYTWLIAFYVYYEGWTYAFFFPLPFDDSWKDGTASDRSIAIFAIQDYQIRKPFSEVELDAITSTCGTFFDHAYESLYGT